MGEKVSIEIELLDRISGGLDRVSRKMGELDNSTRSARDELRSMEGVSERLKKSLMGLGTVWGLKSLGSDLINVRSEMESLEVSFSTLLGSTQKGAAATRDIGVFAAQTPMMVDTLAQGAQTMLAFNIEQERTMKMLHAIGDISMGNAQKFESLSLAYSQMSATGKLMGQDLLQMINAGFNPLVVMSDKTGKSIGELKEEMEKGRISVEMVTDAFISATSEGGKFHGMLEKQSRGMKGALSNLEGAIQDFYNDMGKQVQGTVTAVADMTTVMVKHYKTVGDILAGIVLAYGSYRAALIANAAIEIGAIGRAIVLTRVKNQLAAAVARVNAAIALNPWAMAAAAVMAMSYAVYKLYTQESETEKATRKLDDATRQLQKDVAAEEAQISSMFARLKAAKQGTEEYRDAKQAIMNQYGGYLAGMSKEVSSLQNVEAAYRAVTEAARNAARARAMEAFSKDANDDFVEKEADIRVRLQELMARKYGNAKGKDGRYLRDTRYWEVMNAMKNGDKLNDGFLRQFDVHRYQSAGNSGAVTSYVDNELKTIIGSYHQATKTLNEVMKEARTRFGDMPEDKTASAAETRNKAYWEKKKKEAEGELASLSDIEVKGKKGIELKKKIAEYQKTIDTWDTTGKADREAQRQQKADDRADREEERKKETLEKLGLELVEMQRKNDAAEIEALEDGTEKKLRQIDNDYEKRKNEIARQAADWQRENKKAGNGSGLTTEQQNEIDKADRLNEEHKQLQTQEVYREELAAMRDYLKEYGTYQQRKLAIAEEYAEKIRKAQNDGERLTLEKQRAAAIQKIEIEALKQEIDWKGMLGDFGGIFEEQLKPSLAKLIEYSKSDEFKQADVNDQKAIYDLISQLEAKTSDGWSGMFRSLGDSVQKVRDAELQYEAAKQKSIKADEEYAEAVKRNTIRGKDGDYIKDDNGEVSAAFQKVAEASDELSKAQGGLTDANNGVSAAANRVRENMNNLANGVHQLGSGSMSGILGGTNSIARIFDENNLSGKVAAELSKSVGGAFGEALAGPIGGEIVEGIFSLLDLCEDGIENMFSSLIDTVLGAVDGLLGSLLNMRIPLAIADSLKNGIGNILNTVTFGGFSSWISSSNGKEVAETTERLTTQNEALQHSIDKLKDSIDKNYGGKAIGDYQKTFEAQKAQNENMRQILSAQQGYHGAHHSNAYYWNISQDMTAQVNKLLGTSLRGASWADWAKLTPEQMEQIRTYLPNIWEVMLDQGKYDKSEYFEQYADQAGKIEELTVQIRENLMGTSFSGLRDSFISQLMDMETSAEDFAGDFSEMMQRALLQAAIGNKFDEQIRQWYDSVSSAMMNDDGSYKELTEGQLNDYKNQWDAMVAAMMAERDRISELTGYTPNSSGSGQSGKAGAFTAMSQDQGTKLEGMFTSGLRHWSSIDEKLESVADGMSSAEGHLAKIEENTGKSAEHLEKIAENVVKIIRDGLKVK